MFNIFEHTDPQKSHRVLKAGLNNYDGSLVQCQHERVSDQLTELSVALLSLCCTATKKLRFIDLVGLH